MHKEDPETSNKYPHINRLWPQLTSNYKLNPFPNGDMQMTLALAYLLLRSTHEGLLKFSFGS